MYYINYVVIFCISLHRVFQKLFGPRWGTSCSVPSPSSAHDFARAAARTGERQVPNSADNEPFGETTIFLGHGSHGFTMDLLGESMNQHPLFHNISYNQHFWYLVNLVCQGFDYGNCNWRQLPFRMWQFCVVKDACHSTAGTRSAAALNAALQAVGCPVPSRLLAEAENPHDTAQKTNDCVHWRGQNAGGHLFGKSNLADMASSVRVYYGVLHIWPIFAML